MKMGRNDLCPCGSGKKYKKCCVNLEDNQPYDGVESRSGEAEHFYDGLEDQYEKAKEQGLFEILRVLELDKDHSDSNLVQAIDYFKKMDGCIEADAPTAFLTQHEYRMLNRDGIFRPSLYCMLLSTKF